MEDEAEKYVGEAANPAATLPLYPQEDPLRKAIKEKSVLLMQAQYHEKLGHRTEAVMAYEEAAKKEEMIYDTLFSQGRDSEAAINLISAASCWKKADHEKKAIGLLEQVIKIETLPDELKHEARVLLLQWRDDEHRGPDPGADSTLVKSGSASEAPAASRRGQAGRQDARAPSLNAIANRSKKTSAALIQKLLTDYSERLASRVGKLDIFDKQEKGKPEMPQVENVFVDFNLKPYQRLDINLSKKEEFDEQFRRQINPYDDSDDAAEENARINRTDGLLRRRVQALIIGAPGCGKTTLLKYLASRVLKEKRRFPLFLELKNLNEEVFKRNEHRMVDWLFEKAVTDLIQLSVAAQRRQLKQHFQAELQAGNVTIFLDGLDELRSTNFFNSLCNSIREFMYSAYGHNTLIISTRPYATLTRFEGITELEIAPLNDWQIRRVVNKHYGNYPPQERDLPSSLKRFRDLRRVPFLLAVMVRLHRNNVPITKDRLRLYRYIVDELAGLSNKSQDLRETYRKELMVRFLQEVAFEKLLLAGGKSHDGNQGTAHLVFTSDFLYEKARAFLRTEHITDEVKPYQFAEEVRESPFLHEIGQGDYAFTHLTIQEFLAARELSGHHDFVKLFCRAYFDKALVEMEVLPMTLGLLANGDCQDRYYEIVEQLPDSLNFAGLRLLTRALVYRQNIGEERMRKLVKRLVDFIRERNVEDSPYAKAVLRSLAGISGRPLELLMDRLIDLMAQANRIKDFYPKVIMALGAIGDDRAIEVLKEALINGDTSIRMRAARALGQIGSDRAVGALLDVSKMELGGFVLWAAGDGLKLVADERAVGRLIRSLNDRKHGLRETIIFVLGQIGGETARNALIETLQDDDYQIRMAAAKALGLISDEYAIKHLARLLQDDDYGSVRTSVAHALGEIGSSDALPALMQAIRDRDLSVRNAAVVSLGRIGDEAAVDALGEVLSVENDPLILAVIEALGQIGSDQATDRLIAALSSSESATRRRAAQILGEIDGQRAAEALKAAGRQDVDATVRAAAEEALKNLGNRRTPPADKNKRSGQPIRNRLTAADSLQLTGKDGVARGLNRLQSASPADRLETAEGLEKMLPRELVAGLLNALDYHNLFVRKKAALLLGYYTDDPQLLEQLKAAGERESDREVRTIMRRAQSQFRAKLDYLGQTLPNP